MQRQYEGFLLYKIIEVVFFIDHCRNVLYSLYLQYMVMSNRFEIHLHIFGSTVFFVSTMASTFLLNYGGGLDAKIPGVSLLC